MEPQKGQRPEYKVTQAQGEEGPPQDNVRLFPGCGPGGEPLYTVLYGDPKIKLAFPTFSLGSVKS